jgi:ABC-type multidrug transport system fused ATPase/permease subunit
MISTQGPVGQISAFAVTFGPQALTLAGNIGMVALALKGTAVAAGAATLGMRALVIASAPLSVIAGAILAVISLITVAIQRIDVLKRNFQGLLSGDMSKISSFGSFDSLGRRVPGFAAGGIVTRPTLAMIGEGGEREAIIPESKWGMLSAQSSSGGITINVPGGFVGNYDELATKLRDIIVTGQRRGVIDGQWNG